MKNTEISDLPYIDKQNRWSSHHQIFLWLDQYPAGTIILDVGTASGSIGRLCQGKDFQIYGIEPHTEWARLASPYYQEIFKATLDETPDQFLRGYQVIVCADVLEHMPDPDRALARLVDLQSNGTDLIISVPNIANLWVRLNLLFGNFTYTDRGILDRTHLRFFTQKTFVDLLRKSGCRIQRFTATPIPLDLIHPFFQKNKLGILMLTLLANISQRIPTVFGYQFIALIRKSTNE